MPHNNVKVLITRSQQKSENCALLFSENGYDSIVYPCIHYASSDNLANFLNSYQVCSTDSWIFISPASVKYFAQHENANSVISTIKNVFSIGKSTARELQRYFGVKAIYPKKSNSENFIMLPELQAALNSRFYIARAQSGRDKIRSFISNEGAAVEYVETYRANFVTQEEISQMIHIINVRKVNCIVITSFELFKHLVTCFEFVRSLDVIQRRAITVVNKRMHNWAISKGFANIIELPAVDNESIVRSVTNYYKGSLNV